MRAQQVRIIGGLHRSRLIRFPDKPGLRPTPDRVRETLFNWLGQDLAGRHVLDLFAGSGALGLEAASRGASTVVLVERDGAVAESLRENVRALSLATAQVVRMDALEFLRTDQRVFDVVFADPPYADADPQGLAARISSHLSPEGLAYLEAPSPIADLAGWHVLRRLKAGNVHAHLLQKTP